MCKKNVCVCKNSSHQDSGTLFVVVNVVVKLVIYPRNLRVDLYAMSIP